MTVIACRMKRLLANLMVGTLLFAQLSHAADVCFVSSDRPAMAFGSMEGGNCEGMVSPNACLEQCAAGDQTTQLQHASVGIPLDVVIALLPKFSGPLSAPWPAPGVLVAAAPPPRLRFCTFLL